MPDDGKDLPAQLTLDHVSPATLLLEKQRQMHEVQIALDAQKEEYARKAEAYKRREDMLRKKDLELQESLVQFNKFLKDKYDKRMKYDRMAQEERRQRQMREKEIASRQQFLKTIQIQCRQLKKQVRQHEQYQAFLTRVQDENLSEWPELESILSRSQALEMAYKDLMERQNTMISRNETLRNEFSSYTKEQITMNLNLNNKIAQLQSQLEQAESTSALRESEEDKRRRAKAERSREISVVIMAVNNLYQRCVRQCGSLNHSEQLKQLTATADGNEPPKSAPAETTDNDSDNPENVEETKLMLDVIGNYMIDFMAIVDEAPALVKPPATRASKQLPL